MNLEEALYRSEKLEEGLLGGITKPVKAIGNVVKDTLKGAVSGAVSSTMGQLSKLGQNNNSQPTKTNQTSQSSQPAQPAQSTQQGQISQSDQQNTKVTNEEIQALQKECGKILKVLGQTIGGGEKDANGQSVNAQQKNVEKGKFSSPDEGQVSLKVNNGDQVKKGTIIAQIKNQNRETPVKAHQDGYVSFLVNNRNKVPKGKVIGSISSNPPVQQESKREQRISKLMEVGLIDRAKQALGNKNIGLSQEDREILNNFNKATSDTIDANYINSVLGVLQRLSSNGANVKSALNMANNIHAKLESSKGNNDQSSTDQNTSVENNMTQDSTSANQSNPSQNKTNQTGQEQEVVETVNVIKEIRNNLNDIINYIKSNPELVNDIKQELEVFNNNLEGLEDKYTNPGATQN